MSRELRQPDWTVEKAGEMVALKMYVPGSKWGPVVVHLHPSRAVKVALALRRAAIEQVAESLSDVPGS